MTSQVKADDLFQTLTGVNFSVKLLLQSIIYDFPVLDRLV